MLGRFDDVVVESGLHGLHGDFFAAGPRDHDHRTVGVPAFDGVQDGQAIRPGKLVVCQDEVVGLVFFQGAVEISRVEDRGHPEIGMLAL